MSILPFLRRRTLIGALVRAAISVTLLFSLALFTVGYLWTHHSLAGLPAALVTALIGAAVGWIATAIAHSTWAVLLLITVVILWRRIFGRRRR